VVRVRGVSVTIVGWAGLDAGRLRGTRGSDELGHAMESLYGGTESVQAAGVRCQAVPLRASLYRTKDLDATVSRYCGGGYGKDLRKKGMILIRLEQGSALGELFRQIDSPTPQIFEGF